MDRPIDRRTILGFLASLPLAASTPAFAKRPSFERLIAQARGLPSISARMSFISLALLGTRYRENTLIGGPQRDEVFVVRDDAFDCVTFCEVVLAVALAHDLPAFE